MDIEEEIALQNQAFVYYVNRKFDNVLPDRIIEKQLLEGSDPHALAKLIIVTNIEKKNYSDRKIVSSRFLKIIKWLRNVRFK